MNTNYTVLVLCLLVPPTIPAAAETDGYVFEAEELADGGHRAGRGYGFEDGSQAPDGWIKVSAKWDWDYPSIRLMQLRDGFEDFEYLNLLRKWIQLGRRHAPQEQDRKLLAEAESLLQIADDLVGGDFYSATRNCQDLKVARKRVGDMIEKLRLTLTGTQY